MTEKYQQEIDTLKAIVASQEEKIDSLVSELEKLSQEMTMKPLQMDFDGND